MAVEASQPLKHTFEAGADLSALQYHFVKLNSSGQVVAIAAITDIPIGVLQNKPSASGRAAEVVIMGITKIKSDEALDEAETLGTSADGQGVGNPGATVKIVGQVLKACASGEITTAVINCCNPVVA